MSKYPDYNITILLVDDDAMVRTVLLEYLLSYGFVDVIQCRNVPQALEHLKNPKKKIDLILSDWEMPGESGLDLLKATRKNNLRKNTPFVMITSQESMERLKITKAAQSRVSDYLVKPFTSDILKKRIWAVMGWEDLVAGNAS